MAKSDCWQEDSAKFEAAPCLCSDFTPSIPVLSQNLIDLCHGELVELHDLGLSAESGRQNEPGFILVVHFRNDPGFMIAVPASPIRACHEMGAGLQEDFNDTSTRHS